MFSRHGGSKKKVKGDFSSTFSLLPPYLLYYVGSCELHTIRKESGQRDYINVSLLGRIACYMYHSIDEMGVVLGVLFKMGVVIT